MTTGVRLIMAWIESKGMVETDACGLEVFSYGSWRSEIEARFINGSEFSCGNQGGVCRKKFFRMNL